MSTEIDVSDEIIEKSITTTAVSSLKKNPSDFLRQIIGKAVIVKLNSGVTYKGILACLDGFMNIAMEQTEEYHPDQGQGGLGQLKARYGDCFIRGNNDEVINKILIDVLPSMKDQDENIIEYFISLIKESEENITIDYINENIAPFIESYSLIPDNESLDEVCTKLFDLIDKQIHNNINNNQTINNNDNDNEVKLLDKVVVLADITKNQFSASERETIDTLWGFQSIRNKKNTTFESMEAVSSKNERKVIKEQKKFLNELENQIIEDNNTDSQQISTMKLPDLSGNSREKDIHVNKFNITFGGQILLDNADLRIVYGRRYGLIGRNGVGKTTLLKHMASFDIEGFPKHHRVLHVKQEVDSSSKSVLQVVLDSDVERNNLLLLEKQLLNEQQLVDHNDSKKLQDITNKLTDLYERMNHIGAQSAESRAASILSGLQFDESMQNSSTSSLSGGWRMRVSLAAALFIEPDLLMLDEPTNHLDLEAVLWLQNYLLTYKHTVLLVSHDRAFLDEVCTDIILFKNQKLIYFKGNYSQYESTSNEMMVVQTKQREAQQVKIIHMQEFVDKFRYNAKRASLVQSRIKSLEKETIIEEVEDEIKFQFSFPDSGELGYPVIQIDNVSFGYNIKIPLFTDVNLSIDQSSRVALVGPNGAGKSTLLKLIQSQLEPSTGIIHVNPQLRLGIFTQHHLDSFDLSLSSLENMQRRWPLASEAEIRSHLGRFEIHGNDALKPMKFTSGGQKSRVAFACLTYTKPHVVILDEPTNHLDMNAIEALINALKKFTGGVLVVSHDQHFITSVCNELWVIANRKVDKFKGEFKDYKRKVIKEALKKSGH